MKQRINLVPREESPTGIVGVSYCCIYGRKGRTDNKALRASFGAKKSKKFSVNKYGERKAFELACTWRIEQVRKNEGGIT